MVDDILIGQRDIQKINWQIPNINLIGYNVSFVMSDQMGHDYTIPCIQQSRSDTYLKMSDGGICIPFSQKETAFPGLYWCHFVLKKIHEKEQLTYPLDHYITVRVRKSAA